MSTLKSSSFWLGVLTALSWLVMGTILVSIGFSVRPVLDILQVVPRADYNGKVTEVKNLKTQVFNLTGQVATVTTERDNARTERDQYNTSLMTYRSLLCSESWEEMMGTKVGTFNKTYQDFMRFNGFMATALPKNSVLTTSRSSYEVLLMDIKDTRAIILNVDRDCIIVNPEWKTLS